MSRSVFLGLVTYAGTQYPESSSDGGLVRRLARELRSSGAAVDVSIHSEDRFEDIGLTIDASTVRESIDAELGIEGCWRKRLSPSTPAIAVDAFMGVRRLYRHLRYSPPWARALRPSDPGPRMVRRLVNIELAHMSLLREATDSGAEWALIVEDDANCSDIPALGANLRRFMDRHAGESQPQFMNMSRSFSDARLRGKRDRSSAGLWDEEGSAHLVTYGRAVTNTVCAVLYRGEFLSELVPQMDAIPVAPVVPIDWKLNQALMLLERNGNLAAGDCWAIDPAPIIQGSMHGL